MKRQRQCTTHRFAGSRTNNQSTKSANNGWASCSLRRMELGLGLNKLQGSVSEWVSTEATQTNQASSKIIINVLHRVVFLVVFVNDTIRSQVLGYIAATLQHVLREATWPNTYNTCASRHERQHFSTRRGYGVAAPLSLQAYP